MSHLACILESVNDDSGMRACGTCGEVKEPTDFYVRSDGLRDLHCKECVREASRIQGFRARREQGATERWKPTIVGGQRQCSRCREWRDVGDFYKQSGASDGRQSLCKECVKADRKRRHEEQRGDKPPRRKGIDPEAHKRWVAANADRIRERTKATRQANVLRYRGYVHKRKARMLALPVNDLTVAQWEAILRSYGHACAYCGDMTKPLAIDHKVPVSRQGGHTASNVVPACKSCNSRKRTRTPEEWAAKGGYPLRESLMVAA